MWQTTFRGEFSAIFGMSAIVCNEAQEHCVDLMYQDLRMINCCWCTDTMDSGYIMQDTDPDKCGERKPGMTS